MYFCGDNHHGKIRHSLRQNKNLDQNCDRIKNYGLAENFNSAGELSCYIYTGRGQSNVAKKHLCLLKINLRVKIKVKNQPWRQNKGLRKSHHGKISKLNY